MSRKVISIVLIILVLISIIPSLILFIVTPESVAFRVLVSVSTLFVLFGLGAVLTSVQKFFAERREIGKRLLFEVRIHRAETRLLRSELDESFDSISSLIRQAGDSIDGDMKALPLANFDEARKHVVSTSKKQDIERSKASNQTRCNLADMDVINKLTVIEDEIHTIASKVSQIHNAQTALLPTMTRHYSIRTKQLVSMLEGHRRELESLRNQN